MYYDSKFPITAPIAALSIPQKEVTFEAPDSLFSQEGFLYQVNCHGRDKYNAFQLRKAVYVDEYDWAEGYKHKGIEVDVFDAFSNVSAVRSPEGDIVATFRVTDAVFDWMATECYDGRFRAYTESLKVPGITEISRLCIQQGFRSMMIDNDLSVFDLLLAGLVYQHKRSGIKGCVFVTHWTMYKYLTRKGLIVTALCEPEIMPDGCKISAFYLDVDKSYREFKQLTNLLNH